jgi:rhodanese-related sulfurtransferase
MRRSIVLTGNKLVVLAVVLVAVVLALAAAISHSVRAAETKAAVESIAKDAGQVTAGELAQWIIEKRQDYQLIDLREPWQFDDYHIPTAINIPFAQFFGPEARLDKNKKIVVYGLGAGHSAQTQLLLAMKGYRAYALNDGIIAWWDEVMTPTSIRSANPQSSGYQQARQLRDYFMSGGRAGEPPTAVTAPPPQPPAAATPAKPVVKTKPAAKPAAKPAEKPPKDKEKDRLKLGTGCS